MNALKSRWRLVLLIVTASALLIAVLTQMYWERRVNVILITLDTTRADRLGVYGYRYGLTQAFDRYAETGVVFDRAYSSAPITLPSHTTMLTGLYPPEHGLRVNGQGRLAVNIPFLPEILKKQGYETAAILSAAVLDAAYGLDRGFDLYDDYSSQRKSKHLKQRRRPGSDVVDQALAWLSGRASKPFFCWIHLFDAHAPYNARAETFGERFNDTPYDAGIAAELSEVERVLAALRERQLDKKTLVIIAADHGEGLGDHGEMEHGNLAYNSTLHVPLVFAGIRQCQPGRRISTTVSLADITPTVLDLLGISPPKHVSGRSLKAALAGREISARPVYAEAESPLVFNHWCPLHLVISDRWKYIQSTRPELYNMRSDFSEETDLAETTIDQRKEMENTLEILQESFALTVADQVKLSDKKISDLNALGYVGIRHPASGNEGRNAVVLKDIKDMIPSLEKFDRAKQLSIGGHLFEAIGLLREIDQILDQGEFVEASYLLGDCLVLTDRPEEAVAVFQQILAKRPDLVNTHYRLGSALAKQGEFDLAAEEFRRIVEAEPNAASAHCELARMMARTRKYEGAIREYREALRIAPEMANANRELGLLYGSLKRPKEAAACFENAIKYDPQDAVAWANLWGALVQLGQYEKALYYGKKAVEIDPKSFEARYNLGVFLVSLNRAREGIEQLREAQKLQPDDLRPAQQIQQAEAGLNRGRK